MLRKKFSAPLDGTDLQWLIESGIPEGKTLEYKREIPDGSDSGKVKFLRAVTAFANTDGGDLIFGINAEDGVAKSLNPLDRSLIDSNLQRLESLIASSTDPRLSGVLLQQVPISTDSAVVVARVRRSWNSPHRIMVGNHVHYYARNSAGCYQMDASELRRAFTLSESFADRARNFREKRFAEFSKGNFPVKLIESGRIAIHAIPLSSFFSGNKIQLDQHSEALRNISPPGATSWDFKYNVNGWISYSSDQQNTSRSYTQLYRDGVVEGLLPLGDNFSSKKLFYPWHEEQIVEFLSKVLNAFRDIGIIPPIYIGISLLDAYGYSMHNRYRHQSHPISEFSSFMLPETQVDDIDLDPSIFMKDSFDSVWNAFGFPRSFNYTPDGIWSPQK